MWAIGLDLNVAYSVLRLLISFQVAPWYGLVCYLLAVTTIGRGQCFASYRSTINIATVGYQYFSYLFNREIHLLRFICCYFTLIYKKYVILLCFICNHHITFLISQISNHFLCDIFRHNCFLQISKSTTFQNLWLPRHSKHWKTYPYQGSDDHGEGDRNSDISHLDSFNLRQYTTVTNQCSWLPWTWTWRIWYCGRWSHFENQPGRV